MGDSVQSSSPGFAPWMVARMHRMAGEQRSLANDALERLDAGPLPDLEVIGPLRAGALLVEQGETVTMPGTGSDPWVILNRDARTGAVQLARRTGERLERMTAGDAAFRAAFEWSDETAASNRVIRIIPTRNPFAAMALHHVATGTSFFPADALIELKAVRTSSLDDGSKQRIAAVREAARWFARVHGEDIGDDGLMAVLLNSSEWIGNAAAGEGGMYMFGPHGDAFDRMLSDEARSSMGGVYVDQDPTDVRAAHESIEANLDLVLTHEGAHIVTDRHWGPTSTGSLGVVEQKLVREAISDLFAAQRSGATRIGRMRDFLVHERGLETIDKLRAAIDASAGWDEHVGTQVITRPVIQFAQRHGWDLTGDAMMAAVRQLGTEIREDRLSGVGADDFARAMKDAVARRCGATSPQLKHLTSLFHWVRL